MAFRPLIFWDIKEAVRLAIADLGLEYFGDRVHNLWTVDPDMRPMPNIQLVTEGVIEEQAEGDTCTEAWRYPVVVWLCDIERTPQHPKLELYLKDRRRVIGRFNRRAKPLSSVPEVQASWVLPEIIVDKRLPQYLHVVSGLVLQFETREDAME